MMIERHPRELWENLQATKPHLPHFLSEIRLRGIRGIDNLRTVFDYPVSVIAGDNGSGKSTVLFAAACAYRVPQVPRVPGTEVRDLVPSKLFPDYRSKLGVREDHKNEILIDFDYVTPEGRQSMRWRRSKSWTRSLPGGTGTTQPLRPVYLRTLNNLNTPSEVRAVLGMSRTELKVQETVLSASQLEFAQRMLPFRYAEVVNLAGSRTVLFAAQKRGAVYSELHMSAGERAILRLSQEIAQLKGALVLIDEVEAGLHPRVQQLLMLQLQQLALRNGLQVIVTSHSPVVLDSVPANGRVFLERDGRGHVTVRPAYRDIIQDALYGRSDDALNILCEAEVAEGILRGVLDVLLVRQGIRTETVRIGCDTGAKEFPAQAAALRKFGRIDHFVFVLHGDKRESPAEKTLRKQVGDGSVLLLPGEEPEVWVWNVLRGFSAEEIADSGLGADDLAARVKQLDATYDPAADSPAQIARTKLRGLADALERDVPEMARLAGRLETAKPGSDIQPLAEDLENALLQWRAAG